MREYINIHQLPSLNGNLTDDMLIPVSSKSVTYKVTGKTFVEFLVENMPLDEPLFNANKLQGVPVSISSSDLENGKVLTYDSSKKALVMKHVDAKFLFRDGDYRPNKFIRLDSNKNVFSDDVDVNDLIVSDSNVGNKILQVSSSGNTVVYSDINDVVSDSLDDVLTSSYTVGNADKLDDQHGSYYRNASNINAGTLSSSRLSGTYDIDIAGNAKTLDGQPSTYYLNAHNIDSGLLSISRLGTGDSERNWVLGRTADAQAGAVGTYGFFMCSSSIKNPGDVVEGSSLFWANSKDYPSQDVERPSGTWMCMGYSQEANSYSDSSTTVFLRIL